MKLCLGRPELFLKLHKHKVWMSEANCLRFILLNKGLVEEVGKEPIQSQGHCQHIMIVKESKCGNVPCHQLEDALRDGRNSFCSHLLPCSLHHLSAFSHWVQLMQSRILGWPLSSLSPHHHLGVFSVS